jgi:hypothetical protein
LLAGSLAVAPRPAHSGDGDWNHRALATGLMLLGASLSGQPGCLTGRTALKFPRQFAGYLEAGKCYGQAEGCARLIRKVLIQEVDPAWDSLLS